MKYKLLISMLVVTFVSQSAVWPVADLAWGQADFEWCAGKGRVLQLRALALDERQTGKNIVDARKSAKVLWERYQKNKENKSISVQAIKGLIDIGDPAVEFLIQDQDDSVVLRALAIIGSDRAMDVLFKMYLEDKDKTGPAGSAIQECGGSRAASYFIRRLKSDPSNIAVLELLKFLRPAECVIPIIEGIKDSRTSDEDRDELFGIFKDIIPNPHCQEALKNRPDIRDYLMNTIKGYLQGDPERWPPGINLILYSVISSEDVPGLLGIYDSDQCHNKAKNAIIVALAKVPNDETIQRTIDAYIDACRADEDKRHGALVHALFLARSGVLKDYFDRYKDREKLFIEVLEKSIQRYQERYYKDKNSMENYSHHSFNEELEILSLTATPASLTVLTRGFFENIRNDAPLGCQFLEALMLPEGRKNVLETLSRNPEITRGIEAVLVDRVLKYTDNDPNNPDSLATMRTLSEFINLEEGQKPPAPYEGFLDFREGFIQRGHVADCMVSLREHVIAHPDAQPAELLNVADPYLKGISSPKARAEIKIGIIEYVRRRQRVRKIMDALGVRDDNLTVRFSAAGNSFPMYVVGNDPRKDEIVNKYFREQIGLAPRSAKLIFLPDCVHIIIDDDSYLKVQYGANTLISDDGRRRLLHKAGRGFFKKFYNGWMAGISLSEIVTFERPHPDIDFISHAWIHEWQHVFYDVFGNREILDRNWQAIQRLDSLKGKISSPYEELNPQVRRALVSNLATVILTDYQNEMISKIIELDWDNNKDIDRWFRYYETQYREGSKFDFAIQAKIGPDEQKRIEDEAYGQALSFIKKHNRTILDLIKVKAALYRAEGALSDEEANRKAHFWVGNFLHTIHIRNYQSLRKYVEMLEKRLQVLQRAKIAPAAPLASGSALERNEVWSGV